MRRRQLPRASANAVGACDYDEAVWAVDAVARQWEGVANALNPCAAQAVRGIDEAFDMLGAFKKDLAMRGELGLDDLLMPSDDEPPSDDE